MRIEISVDLTLDSFALGQNYKHDKLPISGRVVEVKPNCSPNEGVIVVEVKENLPKD